MADLNASTPTAAPAFAGTAALVAPIAPPILTAPAATAAAAGTTAPAGPRKPPKTADDNEAIVRCMKAWNNAYKKEAADLDDDESDYPAQKAGNEAYLRVTPPLVGYENICQFIACINFAVMTDIINYSDAKHYRANAKLALTAAFRKPKPSADEPRPVGRPPKSVLAAGN
jgi:hypothetical protein